jgi:predicted nucleotidyltransferase
VVDRVPATLLAALADLVKWLDDTKMPFMIIGGVAASVLGRPRLTQDVDALTILPEADWANAASSAARHGILPRVENALDFARRSRVLLMRHSESGIDIDVTFGRLSFEQTAIDNSEIHDIGGLRVRLPRVEDLLVMKAVARRPKDLQDIEGLLAAHPDADIVAVRRWVREFATAMTMPDMLDDFDKVVERSNSGR